MNELQLFENPEFGQIRVVEKDGEPWFVAADVCKALDLEDVSKAISRLDADEGTRIEIPHPQNPEKHLEVNAINEPGLYSLVLGSRKPEAKAFKRWIVHEVLPSIRKTGSYSVMPKDFASALRAYADEVEKRERLEAENKLLLPKAEYFDELVFRETNLNFRNSAKELNVKPKDFIGFLLSNGFVYRDSSQKLLPYETAVEKGLFVLKECYSSTGKWSGCQTLVTPEGRATFRILMKSIRRKGRCVNGTSIR